MPLILFDCLCCFFFFFAFSLHFFPRFSFSSLFFSTLSTISCNLNISYYSDNRVSDYNQKHNTRGTPAVQTACHHTITLTKHSNTLTACAFTKQKEIGKLHTDDFTSTHTHLGVTCTLIRMHTYEHIHMHACSRTHTHISITQLV